MVSCVLSVHSMMSISSFRSLSKNPIPASSEVSMHDSAITLRDRALLICVASAPRTIYLPDAQIDPREFNHGPLPIKDNNPPEPAQRRGHYKPPKISHSHIHRYIERFM